VSPVEPPRLDPVGRLVALLEAPKDVAALSPLVLREITCRVLTGPQGLRLCQITAAGAPAHRIARAIRWLKDHFAEPLNVEALARRVGMSPSAFHLHFKGVTALSPLLYQKRLRLQEARQLMLGEGLDAAEAAFRVGYESPSQFGREYRRLFGAPPRQDVTAIKLEARPATQQFIGESRYTLDVENQSTDRIVALPEIVVPPRWMWESVIRRRISRYWARFGRGFSGGMNMRGLFGQGPPAGCWFIVARGRRTQSTTQAIGICWPARRRRRWHPPTQPAPPEGELFLRVAPGGGVAGAKGGGVP
jgi:AraC-like DNA-binding protein